MPSERFEFSVVKHDREAIVAMNCGNGVMRVRTMPPMILAEMSEMCFALLEKAREALAGCDAPPRTTGFLPIFEAKFHGICHAVIGADCVAEKGHELMLALYDDEDDTAPVLLLVEEQIEEFINLAS